MRIYLLRHAEAEPGFDDAARPLTNHGKNQCRVVGRFLKNAGICFDAVYSSYLVRARQTAELVVDICGSVPLDKINLTENLSFEASGNDFHGWLRSLPEAEDLLLVGHAPTLGYRSGELLGLGAPHTLSLPKGALICLKSADLRSASLKFFVTPKVLGA